MNNLNQQSQPQPPQAAVIVNNAIKSYGTGELILNNLNMIVEEGTIYGLLGASGCGKSTILSCIVGLRHLDSGSVTVFGSPPGLCKGSVGFMPQDFALFPVFNIKELLTYFGTIYGMSSSEINQRIDFLRTMLDLPLNNNRIETFRFLCSSGGESRRTSLALSMLHKPALLVLDEPTVGVDPLLRNKIWCHLIELTNGCTSTSKTTVIITTHYIQECKHCHTIGVMRNGRLLTESQPESLLQLYNTDLLEGVMIMLCKQDSGESENLKPSQNLFHNGNRTWTNKLLGTKFSSEIENPVRGIRFNTRSTDTDYNTLKGKWEWENHLRSRAKTGSHLQKIIALLIGHYLSMIRHPLFLIVQLIMPSTQVLVENLVLGTEPVGLKFGFVNHDFVNCSQRENKCFEPGVICNYMKLLDEDGDILDWVEFNLEEEALRSVQNGQSLGYINISNNFTVHMQNRFLLGKFAENDTISGSTITSRMDFSNAIPSSLVRKFMYEQHMRFLSDEATLCGADPQFLESPLRFRNIYANPAHGGLDIGNSMNQFMQPATIIWMVFLMPMGFAVLMILERNEGLTDRVIVAGVTFTDILVARLIYESGILAVQLTLCFAMLILFFDFVNIGSFSLAVLISFMTGVMGMSFGLLFGTIISDAIVAILGILFINMVALTLSGGIWPLAAFTSWMRLLSYFFPVTLPLEALRSVLGRGWGITHPVVLQGLGVIVGWISINCLASGIVLNSTYR